MAEFDPEKEIFVLVHDNNYSTQVDIRVFDSEADAKTGLTIGLTQKQTELIEEDIIPTILRTPNGWYATLYVPSEKNDMSLDRLPNQKWDSDEWTIKSMKQKDLVPEPPEYD